MEFTITITPAAAKQMNEFLDKEYTGNDRLTAGIRIRVMPGGCSGFSYGMQTSDKPASDWKTIESNGVRIFVDQMSQLYLNGVEVDYVDRGMDGSGFAFKNPNSPGSCGCGSSFSV